MATTTVGERLFVDTDVLVAAVTPSRRLHPHAVRAVDLGRTHGVRVFISGQVLREFLVVATRPIEVNGLGLDASEALESAEVFAVRLHLLPEDERVPVRLRALLAEFTCLGRQIHDANIAATLLVHDVRVLVTANPRHFERFGAHLDVRTLETF